MKKDLAILAVLALAPSVASAAMSPSMVGVGAHGYDFLIGTWTCKNSMPSPMGGPPITTLNVLRTSTGALSVHSTGTNFDALGYVVYAAKTKTWWNPSTLATGDYSSESTQQTGKKTLWSGPFYDVATGKSMQIRDTYTETSMTLFHDLSEAQIGGAWKAVGNTACTKS
jgi:hypothetical protein